MDSLQKKDEIGENTNRSGFRPTQNSVNSLPTEYLGVLNLGRGSVWRSEKVCVSYSFVLNPGRYKIEAWGASGGNLRVEELSKGGFSVGELDLTSPTLFFAAAGDVGQSLHESAVRIPGGCNGGGDGRTDRANSRYFSSGGGASHVAALENDLEHRFLVAGGAGGSYFNLDDDKSMRKGGEGGGSRGNDGRSFGDGVGSEGRGATETSPGIRVHFRSIWVGRRRQQQPVWMWSWCRMVRRICIELLCCHRRRRKRLCLRRSPEHRIPSNR